MALCLTVSVSAEKVKEEGEVEDGRREWMEGIMTEVKRKMGHEVDECQGDIPEALINNLVATMANEIEKRGGIYYVN